MVIKKEAIFKEINQAYIFLGDKKIAILKNWTLPLVIY